MSSLLFGNGTDIVHWQPSPNTRGTFDILTTCLITMLLCVWTAVHLNVSPPEGFWKPKFRKVGWLILALIAPEMIAYTAWFQRQEALSMMREANKAIGSADPPRRYEMIKGGISATVSALRRNYGQHTRDPAPQPTLEARRIVAPDRHSWTIVHGFYATMGGLAIHLPHDIPESKGFLPPDRNEVWFLKPKGILSLLQIDSTSRSIIPNLSKEEVSSKSKADGLAKALVCAQALWFIAQCLTRLIQCIPITLLELNTFGHAVCALLIYFVWWEKPLEVEYPTIIDNQLLRDILAYSQMTVWDEPLIRKLQSEIEDFLKSDEDFQKRSEYIDVRTWLRNINTETDLIADWPATDPAPVDSEQELGLTSREKIGSTAVELGQIVPESGLKLKSLTELLDQSDPQFPNECLLFEDLKQSGKLQSHSLSIMLSAEVKNRWAMARRVSPAIREQIWEPLSLLSRRCPNWPDFLDDAELAIVMGFSIAPFIYGGLHALAWSAHFQSSTERLLWRISACIVMGGVPILRILTDSISWIEVLGEKLGDTLEWAIKLAFGLLALAYVLARAYLVVECFINLSHLPAGAYDLPNWSAYFPHIS